MIARVDGREEMLAPVLDPTHGASEPERQCGDDELFRDGAPLSAEASADIRRDHVDLAFRQPEEAGEAVSCRVRTLGGEVDHQLVPPRVPVRHDSSALQVNGHLPVHLQLPADPGRRRSPERSHVAAGDPATQIGVVRPGFVQLAGRPAHRRQRVDDGGQLLQVDLHGVGDVLGLSARSRHARRDRLSNEADPVGRQRRVRGPAKRLEFRPRV